ncbi:Hypothetical_protein [Hexamita inflata]|uniref:Hypothetical_protein n=1 Tax=Hexamita inflata TaxID=28002 RepID=A0AA86U0M6_9EUKA|nr:Hypothetical protein HINF_LOCUS24900 [Hexamita inflata]
MRALKSDDCRCGSLLVLYSLCLKRHFELTAFQPQGGHDRVRVALSSPGWQETGITQLSTVRRGESVIIMPWTRHPKKTQSDRQFYSGQDSKYMIRRRRDQSIESRRERVLESKEHVIHQQGTSVMRSQSSASNIISMQSSFHRQQHVTGNRVSETCASIICYIFKRRQFEPTLWHLLSNALYILYIYIVAVPDSIFQFQLSKSVCRQILLIPSILKITNYIHRQSAYQIRNQCAWRNTTHVHIQLIYTGISTFTLFILYISLTLQHRMRHLAVIFASIQMYNFLSN